MGGVAGRRVAVLRGHCVAHVDRRCRRVDDAWRPVACVRWLCGLEPGRRRCELRWFLCRRWWHVRVERGDSGRCCRRECGLGEQQRDVCEDDAADVQRVVADGVVPERGGPLPHAVVHELRAGDCDVCDADCELLRARRWADCEGQRRVCEQRGHAELGGDLCEEQRAAVVGCDGVACADWERWDDWPCFDHVQRGEP